MKTGRLLNTASITTVPLAVAIAITACGGGGGGGGAAKAVISEESLENAVGNISETTPYCTPDSSYTQAARSLMSSTAKIADVADTVRIASESGPAPKATSYIYDVSGNCATAPGKFVVDYSHSSGTTTTEIDFQDYCVTGSEGETYYDGVVKTREIGTSTDSGPRISALEMSTDGPVVVQPGGEPTIAVTITGGKTTYGTPATWTPGVPTESAPDRTSITKVTAIETTATETRTHTLSNISLKRTGSLENASLEVTAGQYRGPEGKVVDVRTVAGDPARVNVETGEFLSGSIVLVGAENTEAVITPGSTSRSVSVQVNDGAVREDAVACDEAEEPVSTLLIDNDLLGKLNIN